jgi:hypothetical protein
MILLILASQAARITDVSHQCPAEAKFLMRRKKLQTVILPILLDLPLLLGQQMV